METTRRSDRRKNPEIIQCRYMTAEECRALRPGQFVDCIDLQNRIAQVKVTSVKTWKTRDDVEIRWKFGLREYGVETIKTNTMNTFFVAIV